MDPLDSQRALAAIVRTIAIPPDVVIRAWHEPDFPAVRRLASAEGWTTYAARPGDALAAWRRSSPALVAAADGSVIGFIRALSDGAVTTYVTEVLVAPAWRGRGIASALLEVSQRLCPGSRLDLLASPASRGFYEHRGFRSFAGFRLSWAERTHRL